MQTILKIVVFQSLELKGYYDIVDEARPISVFFSTHADIFKEMHF